MPVSIRVSPSLTAAGSPRPTRRGVVAVEAALVMSVIVVIMLGVWEVGRMLQVQRLLYDAASEGARYAAGGSSLSTPVTVAMVQQDVQNYLTAAGLPSTAVSGAQVTLTNLSSNSWTDPCNAQPLDLFSVTVTIPAGAAFNSLRWVASSITGINQLSVTVQWVSANDSLATVSMQLPF
jgi:Flp pilus assembly protein TadG